MDRTRWTDDMLDQRFAAMDERLELLFAEIRLLREEMRAGFTELREEMRVGFGELRSEMAADRAQAVALHRQLNAMMGTALVAALGLLGVLIAKL
jgi:hypothetical protein